MQFWAVLAQRSRSDRVSSAVDNLTRMLLRIVIPAGERCHAVLNALMAPPPQFGHKCLSLPLRLEPLEDRMLLSIGGGMDGSAWSTELEPLAFLNQPVAHWTDWSTVADPTAWWTDVAPLGPFDQPRTDGDKLNLPDEFRDLPPLGFDQETNQQLGWDGEVIVGEGQPISDATPTGRLPGSWA